jgi:hypothetical protein
MRSIKCSLLLTAALLLTACGPSLRDAKELGFESIEQMKELQARGYKTMKDYLDYEESVRLAEEKAAAQKAAAEKERAAAEKEKAEAEKREIKLLEAPLSWIKKQRELCQAYDDAPNEIKQSAIFRETIVLLYRASVENGKGIIERIRTNQGGSELSIVVKVGNKIEFATSSLSDPIRAGSKVYQQVENLKENSCVNFSISSIRPSSVFERSRVCDLEYWAEFTDVQPCK